MAGDAAVPAAVDVGGGRRGRAGVLRALGAGERGHGRRDAAGGRDQALPPRPVSYRPLLGEQVLRQMRGLPAEGFDLLVQVLTRICEDPYDRLFSRAIRADDPARRMAEIGDFGFVEFLVDDAAGLVRVVTLVWVG